MTEQTALTAPEQTEVGSLAPITINPADYVAKVFQPFRDKLAVAKHEAEGVTYDITTTAGMDSAKKLRMTFRNLRTSAEAARQDRKAPLLEIGKLLDSSYKDLAAEITPLENRFDADIKAEEARKEAIKAEKARIEAERVAGIQSRINEVRNAPMKAFGKSSRDIELIYNEVATLVIDGSFQEFTAAATDAKRDALEKLEQALAAAKQHEAEQERLQAEREELERQRKEQEAAAAAEAARLKAEREKVETEAKAQRDAETAALTEERRKLDERQADLKRQQEALAQQQAEQAPQPEAQPTHEHRPPLTAVPPAQLSPKVAPGPLDVLQQFVAAYENDDHLGLRNAYLAAVGILEGAQAA